MINPAECFVQHAPTGEMVLATIQTLTPEMIEAGITQTWWNDESLKDDFDSVPIDRYWDWNDLEIEFEGRILESELVGVVTSDQYVQGAMLISREAVPLANAAGEQGLFIELLFTAPRNRSILRTDGSKFIGAVGLELLRWAARFSRSLGMEGRLRLDGSPDFIGWYERLGFKRIAIEPVLFEGVEYSPMDLSGQNVKTLLDEKDA